MTSSSLTPIEVSLLCSLMAVLLKEHVTRDNTLSIMCANASNPSNLVSTSSSITCCARTRLRESHVMCDVYVT